MASVHKHIRSGTASKRPTTAIAEGQIALATNITSPGLFFKDSTGATIVKIGPVHVGTTAPNATPAGSAGNSTGEVWLDTSLTPVGVKIYNGTAFVNATPIGSTTVEGLLELATNAETQTGSDAARAVTSAGLQSKLSDSTSTTSATTIASSTAVKAAFDLAGLALPKTGGTVTGNLEIGTAGSLSFEGATADGFETTIAVVDPTADRTITLPNTTGTVVTTGDTGTVTSTMLLDGTILNEDINASAAIAYSKLATLTSANIVLGSSANVATSTAVTGDVTISNTGVTAIAAGVIVNADVNASAAIAGSKIAPDFGAQNIATTGSSTAATFNPTGTTPSVTGIYSPGANRLGITTNSVERVEFGASEVVFNDDAADYDFRIEGDTNTNLFFADASAEAVGIRTATPVSELNVSVGNGGNITISNTNDAHSAGLAFGDTTSNSSGRITYDHSTNALAISTNGTGRLFVDATGNVGVAAAASTWNLGKVLEVSGAKPVALWNPGDGFNALSNIYYNSAYKFNTTGGYGLYYQQNTGNGAHIFATTTATGSADGAATFSEVLRILAGGNVGIGTSSPAAKLEISDIRNSTLLSLTAQSGERWDFKNTNTVGSTDVLTIGCAGGNVNLNLEDTGRVGIGTTSPGAELHVNPGAGNTGNIYLDYGTGSTADGRLNIEVGSTAVFYETIKTGGLPQAFYVTGSERMRIDSSGRLLVGTTSTSATCNALLQTAGGTGGTLILSRGTTSPSNGEDLGFISFNDSSHIYNNAIIRAARDGGTWTSGTSMPTRLVFSTTSDSASSPTERMRINNAGEVTTTNEKLNLITVGRGAGAISTNTAIGSGALLSNTTGGENTATGLDALRSNTTGGRNTATGLNALYNNTANDNTAVGSSALVSNTTGTGNTAVGLDAGYGVGSNANSSGSNNIFIGFQSVGASGSASNVITLGNGSIATLRCAVTTITSLSDARDKTNISNIPAGLDFINALRPVAFDWNTRDGAKIGITEFGFIAQELQEAQVSTGITVPNLVLTENPDKLEASAGTLLPVLVKAIQELLAKNDALEARLTAAGID